MPYDVVVQPDAYTYELNEELSLLVARRSFGPHAACVPLIAEAERRLDAGAGRQPKVHLLLVDADVEPPEPSSRQTYARASAASSGLFVVVSSSMRARAAALAIAAMKGETGARHAAFGDFEIALDWIDSHRPGVRFRLAAMRARLDRASAQPSWDP